MGFFPNYGSRFSGGQKRRFAGRFSQAYRELASGPEDRYTPAMSFLRLALVVFLCLTIGALLGAYAVDEAGGEPLLGAILGSLAGVIVALVATGEMPNGWLNRFLPPHEDESAESI
jgi:hypothetical protein